MLVASTIGRVRNAIVRDTQSPSHVVRLQAREWHLPQPPLVGEQPSIDTVISTPQPLSRLESHQLKNVMAAAASLNPRHLPSIVDDHDTVDGSARYFSAWQTTSDEHFEQLVCYLLHSFHIAVDCWC